MDGDVYLQEESSTLTPLSVLRADRVGSSGEFCCRRLQEDDGLCQVGWVWETVPPVKSTHTSLTPFPSRRQGGDCVGRDSEALAPQGGRQRLWDWPSPEGLSVEVF